MTCTKQAHKTAHTHAEHHDAKDVQTKTNCFCCFVFSLYLIYDFLNEFPSKTMKYPTSYCNYAYWGLCVMYYVSSNREIYYV